MCDMLVHDFSLDDLPEVMKLKPIDNSGCTINATTSTGTLYTTNTTTSATSTFTPVSTTFSFPLSDIEIKTIESSSMPWAEHEVDTIKKEFKKYKDATDKHIEELEADIEYLSDSYKKAVEQLVLMQEAFNQATVKALVVAETMEKIKNIDAIEQAAKEAISFNDRLRTNEELVDNLMPEVYHLKQQLNEKGSAYV